MSEHSTVLSCLLMLTVLDLTWDLKYVSGKGQDESVIHISDWG
jgi:hypothetical protein